MLNAIEIKRSSISGDENLIKDIISFSQGFYNIPALQSVIFIVEEDNNQMVSYLNSHKIPYVKNKYY
jgi:hypothetical protein